MDTKVLDKLENYYYMMYHNWLGSFLTSEQEQEIIYTAKSYYYHDKKLCQEVYSDKELIVNSINDAIKHLKYC